jgi:hypothetical protein
LSGWPLAPLDTPSHPWAADLPPHLMCPRDPKGGVPRCAALVASVCGLTTTPYQPIDTIADCKERKSGSSDRTWSTMKIVPGAIVMPSLMITVMPSVIVMG